MSAFEPLLDLQPKTLEELNALIERAGPLVPGATRPVFGEGPTGAIAFVGEQPGDQEDLQGRPFVGPAGQLLTRAMADVGLDRRKVYLTNAVKHFKFEERGKRRIHAKPTAGEIRHYRPWLMKELEPSDRNSSSRLARRHSRRSRERRCRSGGHGVQESFPAFKATSSPRRRPRSR